MSREGFDIHLSADIVEGNSGGPVLMDEQVVGVVTSVKGRFALAIPAMIVQIYAKGFGIAPVLAHVKKPPDEDKVTTDTAAVSLPRGITGQEGAPMVLVPAGEFVRGSPAGEGEDNEHPQKRIYLDAFYMDEYAVTTARYAKFLRVSPREKPKYWEQADPPRWSV